MGIATIRDRLELTSKEPLHELVKRVSLDLTRSSSPTFYPVYIGSRKEVFDEVVVYIAQSLNLSTEAILPLELEPRDLNGVPYAQILGTQAARVAGDKIIIKVTGFEKLDKLMDPEYSYRTAHDFDQDWGVVITEPAFRGWPTEKKALVAMYIDRSAGRDLYEKAIHVAASSQFKKCLWEF